MEFSGCFPAGNYSDFDRIFDMATSLLDDSEADIKESAALCCKEQLGNVREHSLKLDMTKPIYLSILVTNRELVITIIDPGPPWREDGYYECPDAEVQMQALAESLALRGRGHLIMAMLTHLSGTGSLQYKNGGRVRILAWRRKVIEG